MTCAEIEDYATVLDQQAAIRVANMLMEIVEEVQQRPELLPRIDLRAWQDLLVYVPTPELVLSVMAKRPAHEKLKALNDIDPDAWMLEDMSDATVSPYRAYQWKNCGRGSNVPLYTGDALLKLIEKTGGV